MESDLAFRKTSKHIEAAKKQWIIIMAQRLRHDARSIHKALQ